MKSNQKGIAHLALLLLVLVIAAVAGGGYWVWHSHKPSSSKSGNSKPVNVTDNFIENIKRSVVAARPTSPQQSNTNPNADSLTPASVSTATTPSINFYPAPNPTTANSQASFIWTTTNAIYCDASAYTTSDSWGGFNVPLSGQKQLTIPSDANIYYLGCGNGQSGQSTAVAYHGFDAPGNAVSSSPSLTLTANPGVISKGKTTKIRWVAKGVKMCEPVTAPDQNFPLVLKTTGSYKSPKLYDNAKYEILCWDKTKTSPPHNIVVGAVYVEVN